MDLGVPGIGPHPLHRPVLDGFRCELERHCVPLEGDVASGSWTPKWHSSVSRLDSGVQQGYITDQQLRTLDQRLTR